MRAVATLVVSSTSGTYKETLNISTTMVTNDYQYMAFEVDAKWYIILSNTTSTITLETPPTAYADLSGKTIYIKDFYAKPKDIRHSLNNVNLGTQTSNMFATEAICKALKDSDACINDKIMQRGGNTTDTDYTDFLERVCTDLVVMYMLRARHGKENNQVQDVASFWAVTPELTDRHGARLNIIKKKIQGSRGHSMVLNRRDGSLIQ